MKNNVLLEKLINRYEWLIYEAKQSNNEYEATIKLKTQSIEQNNKFIEDAEVIVEDLKLNNKNDIVSISEDEIRLMLSRIAILFKNC